MTHCDAIRDLICLRAECAASEGSAAEIDEHVAACPSCRAYQRDAEALSGGGLSDPPGIEEVVSRVARYQNAIKLTAVLVALFLSSIVVGAGVQFLSTLPLLVVTPFLCRLFYHKSWPILLGALPASLVGALLGMDPGVPYFVWKLAAAMLVATAAGVLAAVLVERGRKRAPVLAKTAFIGSAAIVLAVSCAIGFSQFGDPVRYVATFVKTSRYIDTTYPPGTLALKGLNHDFGDAPFYAICEYTLYGERKQAVIGFDPNGIASDSYKAEIERRFMNDWTYRFYAYALPSFDYTPFDVGSDAGSDLAVTRADLANENEIEGISLDIDASGAAMKEGGKIGYQIAVGGFDEYDAELTQAEFLRRSEAVFSALKQHRFPFRSVYIKARLTGSRMQSVEFSPDSTLSDVRRSYGASN